MINELFFNEWSMPFLPHLYVSTPPLKQTGYVHIYRYASSAKKQLSWQLFAIVIEFTDVSQSIHKQGYLGFSDHP